MHPMAQTNRQTNGHGDSMTESAQWGRFSEKYKIHRYFKYVLHIQDTAIPLAVQITSQLQSYVLGLNQLEDFTLTFLQNIPNKMHSSMAYGCYFQYLSQKCHLFLLQLCIKTYTNQTGQAPLITDPPQTSSITQFKRNFG